MKIFLSQSIQPQYFKAQSKKTISATVITPLKLDKVNFTGKNVNWDYDEHIKKSKSILRKFKTFSMAEYDKLSQEEIIALRKTASNYFLKRDLKQINWAYNILEKNLDKLYPNGYVLVSIGRSPACFAKMLQEHGKEVKFCPSRTLQGWAPYVSDDYKKSYAEYLKSIGLTREIIKKSDKPYIFVDYTSTGNSLSNFGALIKEKPMSIPRLKNIEFLSINNDLMQVERLGLKGKLPVVKNIIESKIDDFVHTYLTQSRIKKYSPVPHLEALHKRWDVRGEIEFYKESIESKLFSFHIIDQINSKKVFNGKRTLFEKVIKTIFSKRV